jgi:glycosyltransferase involved in cell wall biosynthesis
MSNLIPEKGLEIFLVFFAKKFGNNDNYIFIICGKNGYNKKLDELVSHFTNKFNNIFYLGVVSDTKKTLVMSVTNCIVLLSKYRSEAQPICILEGYVIGVPVIAYSYKYINDLININNGYLCDYLTENELDKAVMHIESNYNEISDYNKSIRANFTVKNFVLNIKTVINNV